MQCFECYGLTSIERAPYTPFRSRIGSLSVAPTLTSGRMLPAHLIGAATMDCDPVSDEGSPMTVIPICTKTPKGVEEIEKRTQRLPTRVRQVLILIDGKRDYSALLELLPAETLPDICRQLLNEGFIAPLHETKDGPLLTLVDRESIDSPAGAMSIVEEQRLKMARNFMVNTLTTFVGHVASSLINHVEAAHDLTHLRTLAKQWREAIALTADGRKQLADLESRLVVIDERFLGALAGSGTLREEVTPPPRVTPASQTPAPANEDERLAMARSFMLNTLDAFVGLAASSLISRIESSPDCEGLRQLFGDWRDAIALSDDGRKRLSELDAKLSILLP